jgi:hypothetical protein
MTRIEESVEINVTADKAFAFTTDASKWNMWQSTIPEAEQTSPGPVGVGTTFRGTARMMGRSMKWTSIATEYDPDKRFGKNITSDSLFIQQHNTYHPVKGGIRFTLAYDMKVSGFLRLLSPLLVRSMRKELKKSLGNLKQVLEA